MSFLIAACAVYGAFLVGRHDIPAGALLLAAITLALAIRLDGRDQPDDEPPRDPPCAQCPEPLSAHPPDGPCSLCPCPGWTPRKDPA